MWSTLTVFKKWISFLLLFLCLCSCNQDTATHQKLSGRALGTSYNIQYVTSITPKTVQKGIDSLLTVVNQSMSTYLPDSDISRINLGDTSVVVDQHFKNVFYKATQIWKASDGYFDPTVGALVNAYGFGPLKGLPFISKSQKDSLLQLTGWHKIQLRSDGTIRKTLPNIAIDFNALAKGYTVDLLGQYLNSFGIRDYMVEIGGEVVAHGNSPRSGNPWKIAIDNPKQTDVREYAATKTLYNAALATSGNYRKFRIDSTTGQRFVHSVNPKTGRAIKTAVLSASVIAPDCMTADALATALMLMPFNQGKNMITTFPNVEAYWIMSDPNGNIREEFSSNW